jgi:hypothetical protein
MTGENGRLDFILKNRIWVLGAALLLTLPALWFITGLEAEDTYDSWFSPSDPAYRFYKEFQKRFANDMFFVVVFRDDGLFSSENLTLIAELTERLEKLPYVRQVTSLTNVEYLEGREDALIVEPLVPDLDRLDPSAVRAKALSKPLYRGVLISEDGAATAILGELLPVVSMTQEMKLVNGLNAVISEIEARTGKRFYLGGYPVLDVEIMKAAEQDGLKFLPLTIGVVFLVLWLAFRRFGPAALSFVSVVIALAWTFGLYAALGNAYSVLTSILPVILISIGIADAVHILVHYYEELSLGRPRGEALRFTMRKMLRPCLFTTLSTGAGFLSFLSSEIPIVRLTGLFAATGIGLAFVLTVLVLPAALSFLRAPRETAGRQAQGVLLQALKRLGPWTARHPRAILAGSVVALGIGLLGITQLSTETTNLLLLKDGHPLRASYDFIERNLTGLSNLEVIVEGERDALRTPALLEKLDRLSAKIAQEPGLTKTISIVDYVKEINRALHGDDPEYYSIPDTARAVAQSLLLYEFAGGDELRDYVSGDYSAGRLTALFRTMSSRESAALQARVLDYARELELPVKVTGTIALLEAMEQKVTISQVRSLGIALFLIAGLMALLLHSWKLGLLSLVPNALPILLMFAVMGFAGIPLDAATSIVAGLALGIAVDDTIHYLTRFRRELRQAKSYREALIRTTRTVGRAIVFTSVILFAGFSVLLLGTFKGTIYFGLLIGLAMAFALVGDLVLLPALLLVLRPIPMGEVTAREPMPAPASTPLPIAASDDGVGSNPQEMDPERSG